MSVMFFYLTITENLNHALSMTILRYFTTRIASWSLFWRFRHLFQPGFIKNYIEKDTSYMEALILKLPNIYSVLDYGCATGTLLFNLKSKQDNLITAGIDINPKMLAYASKKFQKSPLHEGDYIFLSELNEDALTLFMKRHGLKKFDVAIFDRVLFCIDLESINKIFYQVSKISDYIIIDDFNEEDILRIQKMDYTHRDWARILKKFNFLISEELESPYPMVHGCKAKRMIFKKMS